MNINKIKLKNFRNYTEQEIELNPHINVFYGDNAQGKTNILEAIFISGFGKSFRTSKEKEMIKLGEDFLETNIFYDKSDRSGKIKIIIADKKQVEVNGVKIKKLSELIGNLNLVIFTPDDIQILKNGPAERRRFLDMMIGQLRPNYVHNLNLYLKTLEQRNNYLKQLKDGIKLITTPQINATRRTPAVPSSMPLIFIPPTRYPIAPMAKIIKINDRADEHIPAK